MEEALAGRLGVTAKVILLSGPQLIEVVKGNPLLEIAGTPSRLLVAFLAHPAADLKRIKPLLKKDWSPEALALGKRVAYLWLPAGVRASRLNQELGRRLGDSVTARNWTTVLKIHAMVE
jgi:uncharacterized protein (DUF1697 family)